MKSNKWTKEQVDLFREWHTNRLIELGYPPKLSNELATARDAFLAAVAPKKETS